MTKLQKAELLHYLTDEEHGVPSIIQRACSNNNWDYKWRELYRKENKDKLGEMVKLLKEAHPEDDNEPLTESWLRDVGAVDSKWHSGLVIYVSSQLVVRCYDGYANIDGQMKACRTRGQVRRLISALQGE